MTTIVKPVNRIVNYIDSAGVERPMRCSGDINELIIIDAPNVEQVLGCDKDSYFIIDDTVNIGDALHQAPLVRVVTGGHSAEIVTVQYSYELSLVITGTVNGVLAVWDYEHSKLLGYLLGHDTEISTIHFLWPLPVMLTTGMDGQVILWKVREVGKPTVDFQCLYRFMNYSWDPNWQNVSVAGISAAEIRTGDKITGVQREKKGKEVQNIMNASMYRDFKTNAVLRDTE